MNPLTNMRNVKKLSERELQNLPKSSWHDEYRSSAWIFVGGLPYDLSEGDVMAIFSQYGDITNLNLVRDKDTGKPKGFCFICYEDQRSTVLAVDNFNGIRVLGRIIRVDHVKDYKPPKNSEPTANIKIEKSDEFQEYKTDIKQEIFSPQIKREIGTPEIKREICSPEIKREVLTPEIIRSPDYDSTKKKKKFKHKDKKKKHSRDRSKEKDSNRKYQRERSKEKDIKKHNKSERDNSSEREKNNKRYKRSQSREKNIDLDSRTKSYKNHSHRDRSRERNVHRKQFKEDKKSYKNEEFDKKYNKRKQYYQDDDNIKKYKK